MSKILSLIDVNDYGLQKMKAGGSLQEKTATPTTSQQVVTPDTGYDGMSSVAIGAVTSSIDSNIIPTNIRSGVTVLGVQGNLEPDKPDQSKTVTPTTSEQVIVGDIGYELASVTVEAIQTETKTVKSTTSSQTVTPTSGKFINEITVSPIVLEDVTVKSTTSSQTITPTSGKDGIGEITVSPVNLESKDVSISTNGTTTITPASGYDGISDVDVTVSGILDTSDATAVATDIANGVTAYVNGQKVTGVIPTYEAGQTKNVSVASTNLISLNTDTVDIAGYVAGVINGGTLFRKNAVARFNVDKSVLAQGIGLIGSKILAGNTIIGVAGTATSDATATAGDIAKNKTAYVDGVKLTGNVDEVTDGYSISASQTRLYSQYLLIGGQIDSAKLFRPASSIILNTPQANVATAIGLTADKIKKGVNIIGVNGTYTEDATAVASDIASGKTAYVNGVKLTGAYTPTAISEKDVNFYDYDGTLVDSYTKSEFANLSALPANPSHTGLTAQGWNWTLSDAKTYVADCGKLNIGQMYVTDDNKTRIYITLEEGRLSPYLGCAVNGTVTIDWGDGTTETATGSGFPLYRQHNYSSAGDYVITLAGNADINIVGSATYGSYLLALATTASYSDTIYCNAIKKLELNSRTNIGTAGLYRCGSISTITMHNNMTNFGSSAFTMSGLKNIVVPSSITTILNGIFSDCYSLKNVSLSNNITTIEQNAFARDYSLQSITIPKTVTTIGKQAFYNCYGLRYVSLLINSSIGQSIFNGCSLIEYFAIADASTTISSSLIQSAALRELLIPNSVTTFQRSCIGYCRSLSSIKMPSSITSIGDYVFVTCSGIKFFDFTDSETVPTLEGSNAFTDIASDYQIIVPDNLYDSWIVASYWSNLSSHIIRESDWV